MAKKSRITLNKEQILAHSESSENVQIRLTDIFEGIIDALEEYDITDDEVVRQINRYVTSSRSANLAAAIARNCIKTILTEGEIDDPIRENVLKTTNIILKEF